MKYFNVTRKTLPEAFHESLVLLEEYGNIYPCEDQDNTTHMKEISICFTAEEPFAEPMITKLYPGGFLELEEYILEITQGIKDFKIGDGNCWEYTYSQRMLPWIDFVVDELKRNKFSRRASIAVRDNNVDSKNSHPACLQVVMFNIRDEKLHMSVLFRSNDAVQACGMNCTALVMLQKMVADRLGYSVGSYTHIATSFHAYERSFPVLKKYVNDIKTRPIEELTYDYMDYFKELMDECIPEINAKVEQLKKNMEER